MSQQYLSIWFPHLATDWFTLRKPALKTVAFVLSTSSHGRLIVSAASPLASAIGISTGMAIADARALFPSLEVLDDKPTLTAQLLQRIAEWSVRFTPVVAIDPPDGLMLDASGCTHLWGSSQAYADDLCKRLLKRGYLARAAISNTIGASWALARFGKKDLVTGDGQQQAAIGSLPPASLRIDQATVERLNKLGLTTINDLVPLPATALRRRFGTQILQRLRQALGHEAEFIQPLIPRIPYQERLPCLDPIVHLTGIEIALQTLLESLCKRLREEGKGIRKAVFRGYRVDNIAQGIEISTSRATQNGSHLFHLFSLRLSTIEPALGFELFILEATQVADHEASQHAIWEDKGGLDDPRLFELFDRLTTRVHDIEIQRFLPAEHHLPERAIQQASHDEQPPAEWKLDKPRPIILLPNPEPIEVTAPIPDYPPMNFRCKAELHRIVKADGPERIEQEWWIREGEHRDYYAVEDEQGRRYWLFRSGHYDTEKKVQWYLHGLFA